ncbi:sulfotransferase [Aequorivita sp. H23M31]|uniref:Sulfotransferase n=1 Tax=Aequorivita ciconiae TaxID=2494375 RepID=A0A410G4D2_9FLAO|nr:sulfotransferase [Aequorivita sp. H23M31]QAA82134.1 sulfotransferase [Aequorivita sp. H23M31]
MRNFYVMALGRSGTTLLANILDAHPNIVVPPESFFVLHLERKYGFKTTWDEKTVKNFIDDVYVDRPFRLMWKVPRKVVEASFLQEPVIKNFNEACNRIRVSYNASFTTKNIELIGDKHPIYSNFCERMMRINPEAKLIHMVRDPRGAGSGQINTFKRKDALAVGYLWSRYNKNLLNLKIQYPNNYYLLKYEDLVLHPKETVKSLCRFLEIEFDEKMMEYRKGMVKRFDDYAEAITKKHESLMKPIDVKMIEGWKTKLTAKQIDHIEFATHDVASQLGYHFNKPEVASSAKMKYPFSKLKVKSILGIITLFFNFPFAVRKLVLSVKSIALDRNYKN